MGGDPRAAAYARDQWLPWARTVLASPAATVLDGPGAPDRVAQLVLARAAGPADARHASSRPPPPRPRGACPATATSSSRRSASTSSSPSPAASPASRRGASRARELAAEHAGEPAPVIVQELVRATRELRVYAVGRAARRVRGHPRRARGALGRRRRRARGDRPPAERAGAHAAAPLVRRLGLDVCAFDLLDTPAGPVFLEVNAAVRLAVVRGARRLRAGVGGRPRARGRPLRGAMRVKVSESATLFWSGRPARLGRPRCGAASTRSPPRARCCCAGSRAGASSTARASWASGRSPWRAGCSRRACSSRRAPSGRRRRGAAARALAACGARRRGSSTSPRARPRASAG